MRLCLYEHPGGVEPEPGRRVVYDIEHGEAWFGEAGTPGHALIWELEEHGAGDLASTHELGAAEALGVEFTLLHFEMEQPGWLCSADVRLDTATSWVLRCDRVEFPPGSVAYRHVHPGPGIRYVLYGELTIEDADGTYPAYKPGEAWFEGANHPVVATASETEETAFVRVMVLPREWQGKRTIRYMDPADEDKPKLQRATILLEEPVQR